MDAMLFDRYAYRMPSRISRTGVAVVLAAHGLVGYALWRAHADMPPQAPRLVSVRIVPPTVKTAPPQPEVVPPQPKPVKPLARQPQPTLLAAPADAPTPVAVPPAPTFVEPVATAPTPAPMPAEPPAPTQPRFDADYLDNPKPPYPNISRRLGEQGRVLLRVQVAADGSARDVQLQTSSGFSRLDDIALDTVRRWKFIPARRGDEPIAATVLVPIVFSLKG